MNLEEILSQPNGSIEAISVNLDATPFKEKYDIIVKLLGKLSKTGSITIIGLDVYSFAKAIMYGSSSLEEFNNILFNVKSMDSLDNIKRFLLQNNFKTESCKRDNGHYVCCARAINV